MPLDPLLGRSWRLPILRLGTPGALLAVDGPGRRAETPTILLPRAEVPMGATAGTKVDVFVFLDSEDRPVATTRQPKVELGQVAFLEVTALERFGAFVDWGLPKELLVPFAEQTRDLSVGDRQPIGLYLDNSGRLAGTMRVSELLDQTKGEFANDEWVEGEAWRNDPSIGLFVIVERAHVGLVPASEPHTLRRGERRTFRVTNVLPDRKIELSLRGHAHEELEADAQSILTVLGRADAPRIGDRSSPEEIRAVFGLSKKAFKRAVGRLLKGQAVRIDDSGFLILKSP
jgi:predicted RNA-binding protein (virulence factor B family)